MEKDSIIYHFCKGLTWNQAAKATLHQRQMPGSWHYYGLFKAENWEKQFYKQTTMPKIYKL